MFSDPRGDALLGRMDDAISTLEGIGCELAALVAIHRRMAEQTLGFDPLEAADYGSGGELDVPTQG
jgi:hypothetical protein